MVALKERCGLDHHDILVIGETTAKKVLEYNSTRTETSTKECGLWTRNMAKEHTGEMITIN
jgi:hypothetical protein